MFRPQLAPREDPLSYPDYFKKLRYPLLGSPKYDGIRNVVKEVQCMSRTFKPLPSIHVQAQFSHLEHRDGEVIEGNPTDIDTYNRTQSHVMSVDKPGDFSFYLFDYTAPDFLHKPTFERLEQLEKFPTEDKVIVIKHELIENYDELIAYEEKQLALGFEGIMMRDPMAPYKQGRGTFLQGIIYKLKRFMDDEGVLVDIEEKMTNTNELETDELGYAKRSHKKEGKKPANTTGMFKVFWNEQIIDVAPGRFKHDELKAIWERPQDYIGSPIKFRYFPKGVKNKPRFPRALGWRSEIDM